MNKIEETINTINIYQFKQECVAIEVIIYIDETGNKGWVMESVAHSTGKR